MKHFTEICEPYLFEKENADTGEKEIVKKLSDCIHEERSLLSLVEKFLSQNKAEEGTLGTNNAADRESEDEDEDENSSADEEAYNNLNSELQAKQ